MSKTSRTPYQKITKKRRASDAERKKQVSDVATANSLDNYEQTVMALYIIIFQSTLLIGSAFGDCVAFCGDKLAYRHKSFFQI